MTFEDAFAVDFGGSVTLRKVWLAIAVRVSRDTGFATTTVSQIAEDLGMSLRSVQRSISDLEYENLLEIERGNGRGNLTRFRLKGCQKGDKRVTGFSVQNQRNGKSFPYSGDVQREDVTLSEKNGSCETLTRRAIVILRRREVRDGYLTLLGAMNDGEFITAPGLAKHLGRPAASVRTDLMALFKSRDIPLEAQFRYRKSKGKPWHKGKMNGDVIPYTAHGRRRGE